MRKSALLVLSGVLVCLIACGGDSPVIPPPPKPTATVSASPASIYLGQAVTLTWSSTNSSSCAATATPAETDWSGPIATSGSQVATPSTSGTITYSLQCTGAGGVASNSASETVNAGPPPLAIASSAPPAGTVGSSYGRKSTSCTRGSPGCICIFSNFCFRFTPGFPLGASGGTSPYTWTWAAASGSTLPPGLSISGAYILGVPTTPGTYNVVVTVTDSSSPPVNVSANYGITINLPAPPSVGTVTPPAGAINLPYSFVFTATGYAPLTLSETGSLPAGLSFAADGTLAGKPTVTGSFNITVTAQDQFGQKGSQDFTIQIFNRGFTATGSMATGRAIHTATLLNSGKVLVAGGVDDNSNSLSSVELFDPASASFASAGDMTTPRSYHTATPLGNGKVLIAGGCNAPGTCLASAELYDPSNGSFTATGNMIDVRWGHTATMLQNGMVLLAGGNNSNAITATAELYDPVAGTFTATGSMADARENHTATLLSNGKILIAGGTDNQSPTVTAEIYDPSIGTFSATGAMTTQRTMHTATLLASGEVLVAGGMDGSSNLLGTAELFDPSAGTFSATSTSLITARRLHSATLLTTGDVLLAGGVDPTGLPSSTAELYPSSGTFTGTGSMVMPRYQHTATLLSNGKVLLTGGYSLGGVTATADLY